jgi:hypothetical protein
VRDLPESRGSAEYRYTTHKQPHRCPVRRFLVRLSYGGAGNPTPGAGLPPARRLLPPCIRRRSNGIIIGAMTAMNYIETDLPEGMVLAEWRRAKAAARRKVRRTPRWRLRLA